MNKKLREPRIAARDEMVRIGEALDLIVELEGEGWFYNKMHV